MNEPMECRACGQGPMKEVIDLGNQPLANSLPDSVSLAAGKEPRFPLRLMICPACWMLQISQTVPPPDLFSDYVYFSSYSDTWVAHCREAAARFISDFAISPGSFVVEIASNDGCLLSHFVTAGIPCLGIEPAQNIARHALERGIPTRAEFFDENTARSIAKEHGQADLVLANNVLAHIPDVNSFVQGISLLLKPAGRAVLEFPYAGDMLDRTEFDTIYHEHVFYFTLTSLRPVFQANGLEIITVEHLPTHGGSLRVTLGLSAHAASDGSVAEMLRRETVRGLDTPTPYLAFSQQTRRLRADIIATIRSRRASGNRIAAYGASAKGSTLLNYAGLGPDDLLFIADRSPHKQGKLSPGVHIPIVCPEQISTQRPDDLLLLTWNFAGEIMQQQLAFRQGGGHFIIPIPEVHIV